MTPKVAIVGVSHWHASIYAGILRELGVPIVGSSDPGEGAAAAAKLGIPFEMDAAAMLWATKPDFVIVTPRHDRVMATLAPVLERKLPMLIEKPMGLNGTQAREAADAIEAARVWAVAALPNRCLDIWRRIEEMRAAGSLGTVMHMHFRIINGPPRRYPDWGVPWMLEPTMSGGGSLRNLGIHGADAFRRLAGGEVEVVGAAVTRHAYGLDVEEFAGATLRSPEGIIGTIESGYSYASAGGDFEVRVAATGAYFHEVRGKLTIRHADGKLEEIETEGPSYKPLVEASLKDVVAGRRPICSVAECADAVALCDRIYEASDTV